MKAWIGAVLVGSFVLGCGSSHLGRKKVDPTRPSGVLPDNPATGGEGSLGPGSDRYVLRGRFEFAITMGSVGLGLDANEEVAVSAQVAEDVRYRVAQDNFSVPASIIEGDVSFGSLDVNRLRDNNLRVCGTSGTQRCTEAVIRVYTKDTPGPGLWHAVDEYGAPISSGSDTVGLGAENAAYTATYAIPARKRVVKLKDFSGSQQTPVAVPVSVNFDDAGAGSYATTLVVEYALR